MNVDLAIVARDLKLPPDQVAKTVQLLDEGNTIPFITRFRKDLTGGLNEKQILTIKQQVASLRGLAERKAFILKSIESQGKLTDDLKTSIQRASSTRQLEDTYLPFKPKKQARAAIAKQQGLEPLAHDIFLASSPDVDLATRSTEFVRVDKGLNSVDDVIRGVADLLVERFGENGELRHSLRQVMWNTGKLVSRTTGEPPNVKTDSAARHDAPIPKTKQAQLPAQKTPGEPTAIVKEVAAPKQTEPTAEIAPAAPGPSEDSEQQALSESAGASSPDAATVQIESAPSSVSDSSKETLATPSDAGLNNQTPVTSQEEKAASGTKDTDNAAANEVANDAAEPKPDSADISVGQSNIEIEAPSAPAKATTEKKKKKKKKKPAADPFADYHEFQQSVKNVPHHRVLAINRGERAGKLKVGIQADDRKLMELANKALVPENHAFSEFLNKCAADALNKVLVPSLEREIRRELTESAEKHAVEVFANNLRNLLLQPPIRDQRVLAIDPGFKRGCSVAVLDSLGKVLDSGHVFVVGNPTRRVESQQKLVDWIKQHSIDVIAIGNGAACRQTEQLVSDSIAEHLQDHKVRYVMVNEAGASIYSTSEIGREELPDAAPSIRSAVSIGRRLQDPLSELVKISPANIGVGMYQHDVKAKHLSDSLDDVVEFCVNQVGVNVNNASLSLLRYVSGLNALTARRLVEHRQQINGFKNRQQLMEVNGIGDATFVQAAGFLRIRGGDEPLDSTSIHPESYQLAKSIIDRVGAKPETLFAFAPDAIPAPLPNSLVKNEAAPAASEPTAEAGPPTDGGQPSEDQNAPMVGAKPTTETGLGDENTAETSHEISNSVTVESDTVKTEPDADKTEPNTEEIAAADANSTEPVTGSGSTGTESPGTVAADTQLPETGEAVCEPMQEAKQTTLNELCPERQIIIDKIMKLDADQIASDNLAGKMLVRDVLLAIRKPDWDPRDKVRKPIFRRGIIKVEDLKPEMQLDGQIVNVVDFGVFVDIGLGESSLVHVSQLSSQYVRDPHRFCAVGDVLKVWVSEVDSARRRVKLTAIRPGGKPTAPRGRSTGSRKYSQGKKPNSGKSYGGKPKAGRKTTRTDHPRRKPHKPVKPITDEMLKGDEPMTSFSDLLQFVNKKPKDNQEQKKTKE